MSYESLINALLEEGEVRRKAVLRKAEVEVKQILDEARRAAAELDRQADGWIERESAKERAAILGRAVLAARHLLLQAKHEVLDLILHKVQEKALALSGETRAAILGALLQELLEAVPSPHLKVVADDRERATLLPLCQARGIPVEFHPREDLVLGVEVQADGTVLRNCLRSRIAKAKPELLMELNRLLFSETSVTGDE